MDKVGEAERVIESSGCGLFQVWAVIILYVLCSMPAFFGNMFMVYGNYNPGWACLDLINSTDQYVVSASNANSTVSLTQPLLGTSIANHSITSRHPVYSTGTCEAYEACQRVEFNPEASTIVTQWELLCSRSWILSIIICVQMAGMLVGAYLAGQIQDSFGRKKTLYSALFINAIIHLILSFSVTWEMLAGLQFFSGFLIAAIMSCYYVQLQEFLTIKWRGPVFGVPAFNTAGILFALTAMWLKNWRHIHLASMAVNFVAFLPVVWIPESLRWLEVNGRKEQFVKVANKIARVNRKETVALDDMKFIIARKSEGEKKDAIKRHTLLDLFHNGYKVFTIIVAAQWFAVTCIFFAIYFGIKSLYGNFYINMLLMDLIELPFCFIRMVAPNLLGRKKTSIMYFSVCTVSLYAIACLFVYSSGEVKTTGTVVFAILAKISIHAAFDLLYSYTPEIYPTVVRGLSVGWGSAMARLGGLVSAFLIPNDPDTYYINYTVMGSMGLLCCIVTIGLPETRGRPLKETFESGKSYELDVVVSEKDQRNGSL